jgi:hypothetical protein
VRRLVVGMQPSPTSVQRRHDEASSKHASARLPACLPAGLLTDHSDHTLASLQGSMHGMVAVGERWLASELVVRPKTTAHAPLL